MTSLLAAVASVPAGLAAVLAAWLLAEVIGARRSGSASTPPGREGPVSLLIPAHDEAAVIAATLRSVLAQTRPGDRVLVVADNCSDDTAEIAEALGAEVTVRSSDTHRGKGYALAHGLDLLRAGEPATLIVIDADCLAGPGMVDRLAGEAERSGRPVQALYLMNPPAEAGAKEQVAAFAWAFINRTRMSGLHRLFGVTRLLGTGMAFPWPIAATLELGSAEIVEDIALAVDLVQRGHVPTLLTEALVTSDFPSDEGAAATQRARWEIGSLTLARRAAWPLVKNALSTGRIAPAALAIDLLIPPLVVFAGVVTLCLVLGFGLAFAGIVAPLALALLAGTLFAFAVVAGWLMHGRAILPLSDVAGLGGYALAKLNVYGKTGRRSAKQWTRTGRD